MQTFLFRFKFKSEKLITLGVRLHQNEEENFFNKIVKSELNKIVQGRDVTGTRRVTVPFRQIRENEVSKWQRVTFAAPRQCGVRFQYLT